MNKNVNINKALVQEIDEVVANILTGKYYSDSPRRALTYAWICQRSNRPDFCQIVKMRGFSCKRFYKILLPQSLRKYGEAHPEFVEAVIQKNGKRWVKKSNLDEFVDRFAEKIGNQCAQDYYLERAR